jgi:disulfide bond formation protein DsbB
VTWNCKTLELWRVLFAWLGIFLLLTASWLHEEIFGIAACFMAIMSTQAAVLYQRAAEKGGDHGTE